jgi:very-short-patch-repair endonuclease
MDLIAWSDAVNMAPFDFWHLESLKLQSRTLINYLSTESVDSFTDDMVGLPALSDHPTIWNAPVIFARKRTNDLWSKYAGMIRRDLEQNTVVPTEFITDLVGEYDLEKKKKCLEEGENIVIDTSIKESELFFPLPWNDEQKRIAERLECNYGVVVKGPPGTGKSHTIANLISRFLSQGKTVLVTSQTSKALDVLREKLPKNIRSLAVSQLHQTARRDDVLQQSIGEISSNLGERETKFSEQRVRAIRNELQDVRKEKALLANQIRQYILLDSSEKIEIDGSLIKPMEAAQLINQFKGDRTSLITDKIPCDALLNFSEEDLVDAYKLLLELNSKERDLHKFELPNSSLLPSEEMVTAAFSTHKGLCTQAKIVQNRSKEDVGIVNQDEISQIWEGLLAAQKVLRSIDKDYEREIFNDCEVSEHKKEMWASVQKKITEKIQIIGKSTNTLLGHEIIGNVDLLPEDLLQAVDILRNKVSNKTRLGAIGRMLLPSNSKKVLEGYMVDGHAPETSERIELLYTFVEVQVAEAEIKKLTNQSFSALKHAPNLQKKRIDIVEIETLISALHSIISYSKEFALISDFFKKTGQLSDKSFTRLDGIEAGIALISGQMAKFELTNLEKTFSEWAEIIGSSVQDKSHPVSEHLLDALLKKNATLWKAAFSDLRLLEDKRIKAMRLHEITNRISVYAPNLFQDIVKIVDAEIDFVCPNNLALSWKIARLESWLDKVQNHVDVGFLQSQLERLTKKEYVLNSDLVTVLAWQRQIDKVTKKQRDALMAWSEAMKKYGKGTGKYAVKWLRSAQESLKEAKNAVPVWIMPLHRVAQMFPEPKPGMFDVVIFDEASQCDLKGLTIGYLGKKLLVVGDPDQISPAGIFQDLEKGFELISRFLFDIPHKDTFSITSSLFDLAKIRIPNMIQLNEHFRCVPEIIAFSDYHIYDGSLKPLRHPQPKGLLKPALIPVFVDNGYQNKNNKKNIPEAEAIVAKLIECLKDPNYQKRPDGRLCTFGIISLLAEDQAKCIQELIQARIAEGVITEKEIEERRIECGDAYKFQGDERDVIFLSMVRSLDPDKVNDTIAPLVDEGAKRRFNVAASRARDQMFLFHSIPLEALGNKNDWRFKLLNWFYDPKKEILSSGREALKREFDSGRASQFSFDVGNLLIDRGYQVLPEYPVIGYRIDLVIQGEDARLAVECDGDQYHTLENWEDDQIREQQLRRAGWEFWRVTGSSYYRYKEKSLESLWKKLDEMGIKPVINK